MSVAVGSWTCPAAALRQFGARRRVNVRRPAQSPAITASFDGERQDEHRASLLASAETLVDFGNGRVVACPPLFEKWQDDEGVEDKELICGPRGCVPADVLLEDESGAYGWMDRFHALAIHHKKAFGSKCCYCGDGAGGEDGLPCKFQGCDCTWAFAEAIWINQMDPDSAKKYFREAIEEHPDNAELQAAFGVFQWLGLNDVSRAREHFDIAARLGPANLNIAASRAYFEMMVARNGAP